MAGSNNKIQDDFLGKAVQRAINDEIKRLVEKSIKEAKEELDKRVPEIIAGIIVYIEGLCDMRIFENKIVFEIRKTKNG